MTDYKKEFIKQIFHSLFYIDFDNQEELDNEIAALQNLADNEFSKLDYDQSIDQIAMNRFLALGNILKAAKEFDKKQQAGIVDVIKFYDSGRPYFAFSNFARYRFKLDGKEWITTEHYYQAMKFEDESLQEKVRACAKPSEAAKMGRRKDLPLKQNWDYIKEDFMYKALKAKFIQHPKLKELLISTDNARIIEDSPVDSYWGQINGEGENRLGVLLMKLREELKLESDNNK